MRERDPFRRYLEKMEAAGFRPSTALGQNFLLDPSLHRWLADRAAPGPADTVVEIGVGLGFLTRELAARAGRVVGVEIDERLLAITRAELGDVANIEWVLADALSGPGRSLAPAIAAAGRTAAAGGRFLVVANLPYSVSGPLLAELTGLEPLPQRAVLLVQKEMAARVAAPPATEDYGGLSATVQSVFAASVVREVPPQVFRPRPKVVSAVLQLDRRSPVPAALATAPCRREFAAFVRQLFQQRRKVLRTTLPAAAAAIGKLPPVLPAEVLQARAERFGPEDLVAWWAGCRDRNAAQ
jgi:16S rRNA (adenine1518-N6/adenine1519-N6)-dimethyltransferase